MGQRRVSGEKLPAAGADMPLLTQPVNLSPDKICCLPRVWVHNTTKKLLLRPAASPSNYYTQLLFFYMSTTGTARGERPAASRHDNIARVDNTAEAWWLGGIILQVMEKG